MRRRDERMLRPARVRIRRRKPWVLCRRRLFGWYVRLLNVFTPLKGAWLTVRYRVVSCEQSPVASQLAPLTHERPVRTGTAMDMRHRSTPVKTCQRYVLRVSRVNSNDRVDGHPRVTPGGRIHRLDTCCGSYLCKTPQTDTSQARVSRRHADGWGYWRACLWTTVDPQARGLLSSNLRAAPPT